MEGEGEARGRGENAGGSIFMIAGGGKGKESGGEGVKDISPCINGGVFGQVKGLG